MKAALLALGLSVAACVPPAEVPQKSADPLLFLRSTLVPFPAGSASRLALTDPITGRIAVYDAALVSLVFVRHGERAQAAHVLEGLRAVQSDDGALPFSFTLPKPDASVPYVRSGAVAWVGYAAVDYLDAESSGPSRDVVLALARGAADYLLAHIVNAPGDPREGLVRGGSGALRYDVERGRVRERIVAEDIAWTSVEHNIDAFFFLRRLGRMTGEARFASAADRIAEALSHAWDGADGQLVRGIAADGPDALPTLDCASWGSLFLGAIGDEERAETAAFVADAGFHARDPKTGVTGHRMQRKGPVVEAAVLRQTLGARVPASDWSSLEAVWPEGSAGVALASLRVGRPARARAILDELERLRAPDGSLPTSTIEVPFLLDTHPSIAGTAWVELVRFELGRPPDRQTLWAP